jgi:RecG-like helicase
MLSFVKVINIELYKLIQAIELPNFFMYFSHTPIPRTFALTKKKTLNRH